MRLVLAFAFVALIAPAARAAVVDAPDDMMSGLMSWAVRLSGYPAPPSMPRVDFEPQAFFDANACHGQHCRVWGWYPNTGKDVVYVRDDARALLADGSDPRSLLAASIIVHEFVHYLQAEHRGFAPYGCDQALDLEREAYTVQSQYLMSYGRYLPVGVSMHGANCGGTAMDERVPR